MEHFAYGENSFTFLLFGAIAAADDTIRRSSLELIVSRLKPIISQRRSPPMVSQSEVWHSWLFPNFGKRHGFGEPDAVLCVGNQTFWFEVETHVHLRRRIPAFEQSILQMVRFRLFANAVTKHWGKSRVVGLTLNDKGAPRLAKIRRDAHPVLGNKAFRAAVKSSFETETDHYILLSKSKPRGISKETSRTIAGRVLDRHHQVIVDWCRGETGGPAFAYAPLPRDRFWRIAWEDDLKNPLIKTLGYDPVDRGGFICR